MTNDVEGYLASRARFIEINARRRAAGDLIANVGTLLKTDPRRLGFANVGIGLPMNVAYAKDRLTFDGKQWPSAPEIQKQLADWHAARAELQGIWMKLPAEIRDGLQPPPEAY